MGYIKINRFAETTYPEFIEKLQKLKAKGINKLILDLRDNGGGFLKEAIAIADEFLPDETPILYTKNRSGKTKENFATQRSTFLEGELYVLINENSASASEIVAGALQDNDRGYIVGRRSYGKGLVQREMKLADGSAVRLTVSRYYTPTGRSIQRPYKNGNDAYAKNLDNLDEDIEFMQKGGVIDRFVFDELDKDRSYYNNLSLAEFEEFTIPDEMLQAYTDYLNELAFNYNFDSRKAKMKRYLKASMAKQLFNEELSYRILTQSDPMIEAVQQHLKSQ